MFANNEPIHKIFVGGVMANIWENEALSEDGKLLKLPSIVFNRKVTTADGQVKYYTNFRKSDLPKLEKVVRDAYAFLKSRY